MKNLAIKYTIFVVNNLKSKETSNRAEKMKEESIERIINAWKSYLLQGDLSDYQLEIDEKIPTEFAAIALHLDSRTVKASGKEEAYYEGFRDAAIEVLTLLQVEIVQDDQFKVISLVHRDMEDDKQEELKQHIWG